MPFCAEMLLFQLLTLQYPDDSTIVSLEFLDFILPIVTNFKDQLIKEKLMSLVIDESINQFVEMLRREEFDSEFSLSKLYFIRNEIRPLDIDLLNDCISKTNAAAIAIENKDIILLIGDTGAGKSTTVHFLAESTLIESNDGLDHIIAHEIKHESMKSFHIGTPYSKSETKVINAVNINYNDVILTVCDSPGFKDTAGPEVDIANGVGLAKALRQCRSVRPVILISKFGLHDKCEGIIDLCSILSKFICSVENHVGSFSYIFTKFRKTDNIQLIFKSKSKNLEERERVIPAFKAILADLITKTLKTDSSPKILDPVNDNRSYILDDLISHSVAIMNPFEVFREYAAQQSIEILKHQLSKHITAINNAINRNDFELVNYKLLQLQQLSYSIHLPECIQAYNDSLSKAFSNMQDVLDYISITIEKVFQDEYSCDLQTLQVVMSKMLLMNWYESLRSQHHQELSLLNNIIINIDINLIEYCGQIITTIQSKTQFIMCRFSDNISKYLTLTKLDPSDYLQFESAKYRIDKLSTVIKLLIQLFPESIMINEIRFNYSHILEIILNIFLLTIDSIKTNLNSRNYSILEINMIILNYLEEKFLNLMIENNFGDRIVSVKDLILVLQENCALDNFKCLEILSNDIFDITLIPQSLHEVIRSNLELIDSNFLIQFIPKIQIDESNSNISQKLISKINCSIENFHKFNVVVVAIIIVDSN